jgi:hypothetical protein
MCCAKSSSSFRSGPTRLGEDHLLDLAVLGQVSDTSLTRDVAFKMESSGLPNTFVPGRNLLFLTLAAALAYRRDLQVLVTGVCETDFSGYPDCRDDTMKAMQLALSLGMDKRFLIETPLMWIDKADTWRLAHDIGEKSGKPQWWRCVGEPDRGAHAYLLPGRPRAPACLGLWLRDLPGVRAARAWVRALRGVRLRAFLLLPPLGEGCNSRLGPHEAFDNTARDHRRLLADMERQLALAQRHVAGGHAVEAAQVLGPGFVDDLLDVAARLVHVAQQFPVERALAQAAAPAFLHQRRKSSARAGSIRYSIVTTTLAGAGRLLGHGHLERARASGLPRC